MRVRTIEEIGLLVRETRERKGLTQTALAERIGVTRQWVHALETGKSRPELGLTLRALNALGIALDVQSPPLGEPAGATTKSRS
jgi:y4mF family transcriptional regulator